MDKYEISFIVVLFNRLSYLEMLLWNIFEYQDMPNDKIEVIVVDDGSTQEILPTLEEKYGEYNIKYLRTNRKERAGLVGVGAGRSIPTNLGVSIAEGRVVVICDAEDFMLEPNHLTYFSETAKDKEIASAIPTYTTSAEELKMTREHFKDVAWVKSWAQTHDPELKVAYRDARPVDTIVGNDPSKGWMIECLGIPYFTYRCSGYWAQTRKSFIEMGGFDERLWGMSGDDYELPYRLEMLGFAHIPSPLHILHQFHGTGIERHYAEGELPRFEIDTYMKKSIAVRDEVFDEIKNKTMKLIIPWNPKIHDDDVYVSWRMITV